MFLKKENQVWRQKNFIAKKELGTLQTKHLWLTFCELGETHRSPICSEEVMFFFSLASKQDLREQKIGRLDQSFISNVYSFNVISMRWKFEEIEVAQFFIEKFRSPRNIFDTQNWITHSCDNVKKG